MKKLMIVAVMALAMFTANVKAEVGVNVSQQTLRNSLIVCMTGSQWSFEGEDYRSQTYTGWGRSPKGVPTFIRIRYVFVPITSSYTWVQTYAATWRPDGFQYRADYQAWTVQPIADGMQRMIQNIEAFLLQQQQQPERNFTPPQFSYSGT
jgi:hypothetical protein